MIPHHIFHNWVCPPLFWYVPGIKSRMGWCPLPLLLYQTASAEILSNRGLFHTVQNCLAPPSWARIPKLNATESVTGLSFRHSLSYLHSQTPSCRAEVQLPRLKLPEQLSGTLRKPAINARVRESIKSVSRRCPVDKNVSKSRSSVSILRCVYIKMWTPINRKKIILSGRQKQNRTNSESFLRSAKVRNVRMNQLCIESAKDLKIFEICKSDEAPETEA